MTRCVGTGLHPGAGGEPLAAPASPPPFISVAGPVLTKPVFTKLQAAVSPATSSPVRRERAPYPWTPKAARGTRRQQSQQGRHVPLRRQGLEQSIG